MPFAESEVDDAIKYWFGDNYQVSTKGKKWWFTKPGKEQETKDKEIKEKYGDLLLRVEQRKGAITNAKEGLMMILFLDQFSRHIYREDTPDNKEKKAFNDNMALIISEKMVELNWDLILSPMCRPFVLMPFRHTFQKKYIQIAINQTHLYLNSQEHPAWKKFLQVSQKKMIELSISEEC